jgi:hypothetical protein
MGFITVYFQRGGIEINLDLTLFSIGAFSFLSDTKESEK